MKIGILQAGYVPEPLAEKYGQYPAMFQRLLAGHGFEFETYVVAAGQFPESIHACDGWLITGSKDGAYEPHAYIPPLEDLIREIYAAEIPLAGICFGHQIMAQALGGKVAKFDGGWNLGQTRYQIGADEIQCLALHQDQVITKPAGAELIATSDFCVNAGFAYAGKRGTKAISFQFHPEFSPAYTRDSIAAKSGNLYTEDQAQTAIDAIGEQNDSTRIGQQLAEFFLAAQKTER
ncbi:type 1 glutamine amidotransferase [Blastopirellula marina]|uniref:Glutamine amidotransferase n=1 Tax=Blastopirellula marina TaxID=124 RepID=A0A2S8GA24_9BACT|nr:type 1 glutamine amidotransferase [Blastopirellula marina]PQO41160.1 glutamine amidotransferase [Blastopirellula marina]PTL46036.1 type 1 glutamine amidotransferase [Blastopirellula marina]